MWTFCFHKQFSSLALSSQLNANNKMMNRNTIKSRNAKYKAGNFLPALARMSPHHVFTPRFLSTERSETWRQLKKCYTVTTWKGWKKSHSHRQNPIDFHYFINCITSFNCNFEISFSSRKEIGKMTPLLYFL